MVLCCVVVPACVIVRGDVGVRYTVDHIQCLKVVFDDLKTSSKVVIVDGVGYPAVGSVAHISNAAVASYLQIPVLLPS